MSSSETFLRHFHDVFGAPAARVWAAPGRVTVIGDHTDYQGGMSLAAAVPDRVLVGIRDRGDRELRVVSLTTSERLAGTVRDVSGQANRARASRSPLTGLAGFVGAVLDLTQRATGADILIAGDLPPASGLSSSAALALALLAALSQAEAPNPDWAFLAQAVENRYLGVPSGLLDQLAILHARAGQAVLIDAGAPTADAVPFDWSTAGRVLLVVDTGVARRLSDTPYAERVAQTRAAAERLGVARLVDARLEDLERLAEVPLLYRRSRHVLSETRRVSEAVVRAAEGDWMAVARLLRESHASLADDFEVSVPALDEICRVVESLDPRAGARLTGAGFGGAALALLPEECEADAHQALRDALVAGGFHPPRIRRVDRPGPGLVKLG